MPCSMPLRAAESAVTWAANGVDLREPLKPAPPADSHAMTFPVPSVRVTIVLLNDVLMWAWPTGMFFFGLRRPRWGRRGAGLNGSPPPGHPAPRSETAVLRPASLLGGLLLPR